MNTAIIVAAGSGIRFNSPIPKQFVEILGKPIIVHTLERFDACDAIDAIIVVVASKETDRFGQISEKYPIGKLTQVVSGGATRAESVYNGLAAIDPSTELVAVHDGARPLVSVDEISMTVAAAVEVGAACLVVPVTDTIKEVSGENIVGTLDRKNLRRALTPQVFRLEILRAAFAQGDLSWEVTDECFLVEKLGYDIAIVEGSPRNIKFTHPEDLMFAEMHLRNEF
jgi:2-C-methyl-D-erythritol 4-phosphate cytidylyltransferase